MPRFAPAPPDGTELSSATLDSVDKVFREHQARGAAPSMVWATFGRSGLLRFGHAGHAADGTEPGPDTAYRIASCTKSFTAATVLALRDAGALNLDDPVTRFVPGLAPVTLPGTGAPVPTVRMLLTMSAGFPTDDPWADRQEGLSRAGFDDLVGRGLSFDSLPGTRFAYSNLGYALLGRVIEQASGRDYRDLVAELFLGPLARHSLAEPAILAARGVLPDRRAVQHCDGPDPVGPLAGRCLRPCHTRGGDVAALPCVPT